MKIHVEKDQASQIASLKIVPETAKEKAGLQKIKTDADGRIECVINDLANHAEYSSVKIIIELRPYYY